MTVAYARLCLPYVGAVCLRRGTVGLEDFTAEALSRSGDARPRRPALRSSRTATPTRTQCIPVRVELDLADGRTVACDVTEVLGSPARPLSPEAARAKFDACGGPAALWDQVMELEYRMDARDLSRSSILVTE